MAENLGQWPSKRGPIATIRPSDGYGRGTVPLALERWYDFHSLGSHLGYVGLNNCPIFRDQLSIPLFGPKPINRPDENQPPDTSGHWDASDAKDR